MKKAKIAGESLNLNGKGLQVISTCKLFFFWDKCATRPDYRNKSFFPRTIPEWNALQENAVSSGTLEEFGSQL